MSNHSRRTADRGWGPEIGGKYTILPVEPIRYIFFSSTKKKYFLFFYFSFIIVSMVSSFCLLFIILNFSYHIRMLGVFFYITWLMVQIILPIIFFYFMYLSGLISNWWICLFLSYVHNPVVRNGTLTLPLPSLARTTD
jgi:hypothetical protein